MAHAFAFSTKELQPALTSLFFYHFIHQVLIERMPLSRRTMATRLEQAVFIGRHTPLLHFHNEKPEGSPALALPVLTLTEYRWTHDTMRPDGLDIGLQCPKCGTLSSREGKRRVISKKEIKVVVWCRMSGCDWEETYTILTDAVEELRTGENGVWTARKFLDLSASTQ